MSQPTFTIKRGDTNPALAAVLRGADGNVQDLSAAVVKFNLARHGSLRIDHGSCVVVDPTAGRVKYVWQQGDTDVIGKHLGEFEVTLADNSVLTFPNSQQIIVNVVERAADEAP